jgi:hypothetical protein
LQNIIGHELEAAGPSTKLTVRVAGATASRSWMLATTHLVAERGELGTRDEPSGAEEMVVSCGGVIELGH